MATEFREVAPLTDITNFRCFGVNNHVTGPPSTGDDRLSAGITHRAATGQISLFGYEVGATPYRNITASLLNGWTVQSGGALLIRRVGYFVELKFAYRLDASAATAPHFIDIPAGYKWRTSGGENFGGMGEVHNSVGGAAPTSMSSIYRDSNVSVDGLLCDSSSNSINGTVIWGVVTAWPSTLPGVAYP